ncbi:Cytochrome c4 [Erwinia pyrifoliae DSM 12163]|nr:cytochrome C [Erwinia pyrifoliae]MCA8876148.1 cytochrome C [Erwinia pyrifoliae]CAX54668.1 Bacterial cytochrome c [Erwinia pyrifoliae Ep1/96]CAY73318.1 Cytochrome c4 [Erwinia pyrifoliae DSM 12163]
MMKQCLMALLLLACSQPVLANGNSHAGQEKSACCVACYGAEGKAAAPIYPHLAGQHAPRLALA